MDLCPIRPKQDILRTTPGRSGTQERPWAPGIRDISEAGRLPPDLRMACSTTRLNPSPAGKESATTEDESFSKDPDGVWASSRLMLASISLARWPGRDRASVRPWECAGLEGVALPKRGNLIRYRKSGSGTVCPIFGVRRLAAALKAQASLRTPN